METGLTKTQSRLYMPPRESASVDKVNKEITQKPRAPW